MVSTKQGKFVALLGAITVVVPISVLGQGADGPSFDCGKARSTPEKIICADPELSRLDRDLAELYRTAKSSARDPQEFQRNSAREWRVREDSCRDRACLTQWYEKRKLQLQAIAEPSDPLNRKESAAGAQSAWQPATIVPPTITPSRAPEIAAQRPRVAAPPAPAPTVAEDANSQAAKLIAAKQEYAFAAAMWSNGGAVELTPTLNGMMGTDSFGEKPWCLVALPGLGPEGAKGVAKWRLVYRREKAKGDDMVYTGKWGGSAPPRISFDDDPAFINAVGAGISLANLDFAKRLETAKTVIFKHASDVVFTYDARQLRLAQVIARKACP